MRKILGEWCIDIDMSKLMLVVLEICIRLYLLNVLRAKDKEFRALFNELSLEQLSKSRNKKVHPIAVDATTDELKIAL